MKAKFIFSYVDKDENGIYRDMTSDRAAGIIDFLPSHKIMQSKIGEKIKRALLSYRLHDTPIYSSFQNLYANLDSYPYEQDSTYYILIPSTSVGKIGRAHV